VPSAADQVSAAIVAADGPIPFNQFMQLALYGDAGFYTTTGQAGRRGGDFITSPEVGSLFGTVIAGYLDDCWEKLGSPSRFDVVECGAGPGTLARSILAAKPQCMDVLRYVAVEVSAAQRALHPDNIESRETMPEGPITGVILANELLDNLPLRFYMCFSTYAEPLQEKMKHYLGLSDYAHTGILSAAPTIF
jgi:SAM-dependent MidA family methyltransferase